MGTNRRRFSECRDAFDAITSGRQTGNDSAFFSLAAVQIRRELIDLARHYAGANGQAASFESQNRNSSNNDRPGFEPTDLTNAPDRLAYWTELHQYIADLPDEER